MTIPEDLDSGHHSTLASHSSSGSEVENTPIPQPHRWYKTSERNASINSDRRPPEAAEPKASAMRKQDECESPLPRTTHTISKERPFTAKRKINWRVPDTTWLCDKLSKYIFLTSRPGTRRGREQSRSTIITDSSYYYSTSSAVSDKAHTEVKRQTKNLEKNDRPVTEWISDGHESAGRGQRIFQSPNTDGHFVLSSETENPHVYQVLGSVPTANLQESAKKLEHSGEGPSSGKVKERRSAIPTFT